MNNRLLWVWLLYEIKCAFGAFSKMTTFSIMSTQLIILFCYIFSLFPLFELKLTHIIMPFHRRQLESVQRNINLWELYPPSDDVTNVSFIFYVSGQYDRKLENFLLDLIKKDYFKEISVAFANLEGNSDSYLKGSRLMFERILSKEIDFGSTPPDIVFYMEPDCIPIRSYWLATLAAEANYNPKSPFWVKGSIFRGDFDVISNDKLYNRIHINGNSLYNLSDERFSDFYFQGVRPFISSKFNEGAYDTDIYKLLLWSNARYTAKFFHKFHYSDFIQNYWHSNYSISEILNNCPNTVMIHGGKARP